MTVIESRFPKGILAHLKGIRNYKVEETSSGIYNIIGDIVPIQIINNKKLLPGDNIWLRDLHNELEVIELQRVLYKILKQPKDTRLQAYLDVISRANTHTLKEAINMSNSTITLEELVESTGLATKLEERKTIAIAKNMINLGLPPETIVAATNLEPEKVEEIIRLGNR